MVKSIGPELDREICSSKEGSDRVREGSMRALHRAILEGSLCASRSDFIALGGEEVPDIGIVI